MKKETDIDYKKRLKQAFETILTIIEGRDGKDPKPALRQIQRIIQAQMTNLKGVENRGTA